MRDNLDDLGASIAALTSEHRWLLVLAERCRLDHAAAIQDAAAAIEDAIDDLSAVEADMAEAVGLVDTRAELAHERAERPRVI